VHLLFGDLDERLCSLLPLDLTFDQLEEFFGIDLEDDLISGLQLFTEKASLKEFKVHQLAEINDSAARGVLKLFALMGWFFLNRASRVIILIV
jgi:hypothetical protein